MHSCMLKRMAARPEAQVIAFANQKGGVGKTTTSVNISAAAAKAGHDVLLVDCDPHASATAIIGIEASETMTLADVLMDPRRVDLRAAIWETEFGFDFVPSEIALSNHEQHRLGAEHLLRRMLRPVRDDYDVIVLDCPPSLGLLTIGALTAADSYVVVTAPEFLSLRGFGKLEAAVETIREHYNSRLRHAGVVVNLVPPRGEESDASIGEITDYFSAEERPEVIWHPTIPQWAIAKKAARAGLTLYEAGATSRDRERAHRLAAMYEQLADRMVREHA
jgi:chromosome partitioning protein